MKRKEYLDKLGSASVAELNAMGVEVAEEVMKLRFKKSSRQLEKPHQLGIARRNLARVKTAMALKVKTETR
jgi:ribosomal protein L29